MIWSHWLFHHALPLGACVVLNLDETAVPYQMTGFHGNVIRAAGNSRAAALLYERVPRRDTRGHLTLVSVISADPALQAHLPQFLLPKDAALSTAQKHMLANLAPPVVYVPATSGWVTSVIMKDLLTRLRRAVRVHRPDHHIVVALDAANQHISNDVLSHAARLQIHLLLIPARLTHLLQPLDTHVFGPFKRSLQEGHCIMRGQQPDGILPPRAWITILDNTVRQHFVNRPWASAMVCNGLTGDTSALRPKLLDILRGLFPLPLRPPSPTEMDQLAGRHRVSLCAKLIRNAASIGSARVAAAAAAAAGEAIW